MGEDTEPVHAAGILVQGHGVVYHGEQLGGEHVSSPVHGREGVSMEMWWERTQSQSTLQGSLFKYTGSSTTESS